VINKMKEQFNLSETYRIHLNRKLDQGHDFSLRSDRKNHLLEFCEKYNLDPDVARYTISKVRKQVFKQRGFDLTKFGYGRWYYSKGDLNAHITPEPQ